MGGMVEGTSSHSADPTSHSWEMSVGCRREASTPFPNGPHTAGVPSATGISRTELQPLAIWLEPGQISHMLTLQLHSLVSIMESVNAS